MSQAIATNKKVFRDYFLQEKCECGIALQGCEVKSIRAGKVAFKDTFARVEKGEVLLYNLHIEPYPQASYMNPEPDRVRKLLLNRREIKKFDNKLKLENLALVPTKIYLTKRGLVKVELALGKGKKMYDKRETVKKRDIDRGLKRALHTRRR